VHDSCLQRRAHTCRGDRHSDGGPFSHAAVLARELGISAVVGARGALTEIPDGALIDVDPIAGEVRIVAEA
jgi:phosphoenolpyruvate-protein kinase (PTS system EI component)